MTANLVIIVATTLAWHAWEGGWSWGPRLLLPGIVAAVPSLAPWVRAQQWRVWHSSPASPSGSWCRPHRPRSDAVATARQRRRSSPTIVREYELIGPTARYTADQPDRRQSLGDRLPSQYLSLWQANAGRVLGKAGLVAALLVSMALAAIAVFALRRWHACERTAEQPVAVVGEVAFGAVLGVVTDVAPGIRLGTVEIRQAVRTRELAGVDELLVPPNLVRIHGHDGDPPPDEPRCFRQRELRGCAPQCVAPRVPR